MKKIIKPSILILVHLFYLQGVCGQIPTNMTDSLTQRFLKYSKSVPREEIFIHSDREEYISGEDLWFNIYLIDRQSFKPSLSSRIVYFELLNIENRPILQKRILIDKGYGPGKILLPDTLSTGIYTIRAYTSWMKNFLPVNCFVKNISIYNTLSTKAFKGKLFKSKYKTKEIIENEPQLVKNTGLTLSVNNSKQDSLELFVSTDNKFRYENKNLFYIIIQTHGNINFVSTEKIVDETTKISIPKGSLSAGINQITLFNSKGERVYERFIYTPVRQNNFLTLHSIDNYGLRNKITLEIGLEKEGLSDLNLTNLSISVAPPTSDQGINDINDYLVFGTEYGAQVLNLFKGRKISEVSPEVMDSILLNVSSNWIDWKQILSGDIPHFKYLMEKDDHFLLGRLIYNDQKAVHSSEFILLCNPGKDAAFQYTRTDNEGNFRFNINIDEALKDFIILPDDIAKNQNIIIESSFSDLYTKSDLLVDSPEARISPLISKFSVNHQVQTIFGVSSSGGSLIPVYAPLIPHRFYGKPDIELILADYINLPVMREIFFELLPGVSLKEKKSKYEVSITERVNDRLTFSIPTLMIDGVIIQDPSLIVNLDPETVERIDVVRGKYLVGKYFFSGIVNVITKAGDFGSVLIPDYMSRLHYKVLDPVLAFVSPDYSSEEMRQSRIPDYRNTLYWNPTVKPGKDGKARIEFWSSDNKSDYLINIQGITQEGKTLSIQKIIKVK